MTDGAFPRTYHSPRAEAIYEQCPWDRAHVAALYPAIAVVLVEDTQCRKFVPTRGSLGHYRVYGNYFQAVYARAANPVFEALTAMQPVETQDDAEWSIWRLGKNDEEGYALSSTFALTPGQFKHQPEIDEWLWHYGLGLEPHEFFVEGVAYFDEISPESLLDAMGRLVWLENAFSELNERYETAGRSFWNSVVATAVPLESSGKPDVEAVLPPQFNRAGGWKRRQPVKASGDSPG